MVIHKDVSPFGDWIIFMSGHMLYKKWPDGRSLLFDKWGHPISNQDRDNSISADAPSTEISDVTSNPYSQRNRDTLIIWVKSLLEDVCANEDLVARATNLYTVAADALYWKVDEKLAEFSIPELRDHFNLKTLIDLNDPSQYPTMPVEIRSTVRIYLESLPGYRPHMGYKQPQETFDWHAQSEMDLTKLMGSLADTYGYIFDGPSIFPAKSPFVRNIPADIAAITSTLEAENGGALSKTDVETLIYAERLRWQGEIERLRNAADYIAPYLRWTVGEESPGHHPTMPSAVAAFHVAFDIDTEEKRMARMRAQTAQAVAANTGDA